METIKNKQINIIEKESYNIESSYIDLEKNGVHIPIKFAQVNDRFYFDVDVVNELSDKIRIKYDNLKFTGKWDFAKNECIFFYE